MCLEKINKENFFIQFFEENLTDFFLFYYSLFNEVLEKKHLF